MDKKLVIENGLVVAMADGVSPAKGDLYVEGNRIVAVGPVGHPFPKDQADQRLDASGCAVLPGLINLHTHTPMTLMRSSSDDVGFPQPDQEPAFPEGQDWRANITADDHYWSSCLAIAEMIRTGTTTFVDMYRDMDRVAEAVVACGVRGVLGWEIFSFRNDPDEWLPYDEEVGARTLEESGRFAAEWHGKGAGRVTAVIAPHEAGTCHEPWLSRSAQLAEELGLDITIHVAESLWELEVCQARYGLTPVQALDQAGIFSRRVIGAHSLHLADEDIALLPRDTFTAVSCLSSYLKLASAVTPVPRLLEAGVRVGLGTDSAATNNNLNMWEEIYLTAMVHGFLAGDAGLLPGVASLQMATLDGAAALGWEDKLGSLEVGKKADIVVLDLRHPHLHPLEGAALYGNLQYAATGLEVRDVIVDGRILMQDRVITAFDEPEVIRQVDAAVRRLRDEVDLPVRYSKP